MEDIISQEKEMIEGNEYLKSEFENGNDLDTTYTSDTKTLKLDKTHTQEQINQWDKDVKL